MNKDLASDVFIAFECTSTVQSSDGSFASMTSQLPVQLPDMSQNLQLVYLDSIKTAMSSEQGTAHLYLLMLNIGNYYEIQAEIDKQLRNEQQTKDPVLEKWRQLAYSVVSLFTSQRYHMARIHASYYPSQSEEEFIQKQNNIVQTILSMAPDSVKKHIKQEQINGAEIEVKIPLSTSELFIQTLEPQMIPQLNEMHLALLDNSTRALGQKVQQLLKQIERQSLNADLYTFFLEMQHAAQPAEQQAIYNKLQLSSDELHIRDIAMHCSQFLIGLIPLQLTPTHIHAMQDYKGRMHITMNLMYTAEMMIPATLDQIKNQNVKDHIMKVITEKNDGIFSGKGKMNSDIARLVEDNININNTEVFRDTLQSNNPAVHNGPQTLHQVLQQQKYGSTVKLDNQRRQELKTMCAIALACVKLRFAAVKQSDYECVPQGDVDLLYKVIRCSGYIKDPATGSRLTEDALMMIETIMAYNAQKLQMMANGVPFDEVIKVKAVAELEVSKQLVNIPLIADESGFGEGKLTVEALRAMYTTLCMQNRYTKEVIRRTQRRQMIQDSVINSVN